MAKHRSPGGHVPSPAVAAALRDTSARERASARDRGSHRSRPPSAAARGKMVVAAVAAGAFTAAAVGQSTHTAPSPAPGVAPLASDQDDPGSGSAGGQPDAATGGHNPVLGVGGDEELGIGGDASVALPASLPGEEATADEEVQKLAASQQVTQERLDDEAEEDSDRESGSSDGGSDSGERAGLGSIAKPADGILTSTFGARWGTSHNGIDIAGPIGTPLYAVTDGTVLEAGPASGFGLWVRIKHDDGFVSVYGHMDSFSVEAGERVAAGDQIAEMGNRGHSTGPHLHFEIWEGDGGAKIDPLAWLVERGISL